MYLIDTNVISELPRPRPDPAVLAWFAAQRTLVVSAITIEELSFGIERARPEQAARLRPWFEQFLALPPQIIPVDDKIARTAGLLRAAREASGRIVAQADMLIAATAIAEARVLVTRNEDDFIGCGVPLLNPFTPTRRR